MMIQETNNRLAMSIKRRLIGFISLPLISLLLLIGAQAISIATKPLIDSAFAQTDTPVCNEEDAQEHVRTWLGDDDVEFVFVRYDGPTGIYWVRFVDNAGNMQDVYVEQACSE